MAGLESWCREIVVNIRKAMAFALSELHALLQDLLRGSQRYSHGQQTLLAW